MKCALWRDTDQGGSLSPGLALSKVDPGKGLRFEEDNFPDPPRDVTFRKLMAVLGPAVIALGGTIGGGEWLVGPSLFVKCGLALLWIPTISSTLQVFLNLEMCRYTLYTDEPITVGFMRLSNADHPRQSEVPAEGIPGQHLPRGGADPDLPVLRVVLPSVPWEQVPWPEVTGADRGFRRPAGSPDAGRLTVPHESVGLALTEEVGSSCHVEGRIEGRLWLTVKRSIRPTRIPPLITQLLASSVVPPPLGER
jgi:hypothetical protein